MNTSQRKPSQGANNRDAQRAIAESTLAAISRGSYMHQHISYDLTLKLEYSAHNTRYYAPASLAAWKIAPTTPEQYPLCSISILEMSTLDGARFVHSTSDPSGKIGVLNFASAKKRGGGFLSGAQAQEESIARSSTVYPSLMTPAASEFYNLHHHDPKGGYYSHAMIYSPEIVFFRDDDGKWCAPINVDVLTSCAVNAGVVRNPRGAWRDVEERVDDVMKERMGRLLWLFEQSGATDLVLGSFGTGMFKNNVATVARIWAELLDADGARFKGRFKRIVFAILGTSTFNEFTASFEGTVGAASTSVR